MRISDWSSVVCSSDLLVNIGLDRAPVALCDVEHLCPERCDLIIEADAIGTLIIGDGQRVIAVPGLLPLVIPLQHRLNALASGLSATTMLVDRTSVVSGKSGSARVDFGGPLFIK